MPFPPTLIQNLIALVSAGLGSLLAIRLGVSHRHLCALISFAAGTLIATTFFHIIPEASESLALPGVALALGSGYLLFHLVSRFIFHVCPACAASHFDEQTVSVFRNIAFLLVVALGIHCVMDGVAIALGGELTERVDRSIFAAVSAHKFPEGLALTGLLLRAGLGRKKSFYFALGIEALTVAGWGIGLLFLLGGGMGDWFYLALAHIGGGFIYLGLHATLNESREHSPRFIIFFFLLGVASIALTDLLP